MVDDDGDGLGTASGGVAALQPASMTAPATVNAVHPPGCSAAMAPSLIGTFIT